MNSHHPLKLDLNNLFTPALKDGIADISELEKIFKECHPGVRALKQTGQLPYSKLPEDLVSLAEIQEAAKKYQGYQNVIVFGIGGSALGTLCLAQALLNPHKLDAARLHVADYIDAFQMETLCQSVQGQKNLFVFVSKSGNTSETLAQLLYVKNRFPKTDKKDFFIVTDAKEGFLRQYASDENIATLPVPAGVGGRFSVFTAVGLFPLAVCGVDIAMMLKGAEHTETLCQNDLLVQNPAGLLATSLYYWTTQKNITQVVLMPYSERLVFLSDFFAQLWAESLGKKHTLDGKDSYTGTTAIKTSGPRDQHSQLQLYLEGPHDKVVLFIDVDEQGNDGNLGENSLTDDRIKFLSGKSLKALQASEKAASEESLRENNRPNLTLTLSAVNEFQMGQVCQLMMSVIPYMGVLLNINAFDQPAVERIKKFTYGLMGRKGFEDFGARLADQPKNKKLIF